MIEGLKYHQRTFELLGQSPKVSATHRNRLQHWQKVHNCQLPEAFVEWFSLNDSETRLETPINDFLVPDFDSVLDELSRDLPSGNNSEQKHLVIGYWSGGARLRIGLNDGNDPLLMDLRCPELPTRTFSEFVFQQSWINKTQSFDPLSYFKSTNSRDRTDGWNDFSETHRNGLPAFKVIHPFGPRETRLLFQTFSEGSHFYARGKWVPAKDPFTNEAFWAFRPISYHQFFTSTARLQVFSKGNPKSHPKEAFWDLTADSIQALKETANSIVQSEVLPTPFTLANELGKAALKQHRTEFGC